jgi:hypothetical protein
VLPGQWDNGDEQFNTSASAAAGQQEPTIEQTLQCEIQASSAQVQMLAEYMKHSKPKE